MGRVSLGGVGDLFQTPPAKSPKAKASPAMTPVSMGKTPDSILYADIPDTPNGPGEMFVSPLSSTKSSAKSSAKKSRKSVPLVGVKELFRSTKKTAAVSPAGVKRLMKTPKTKRKSAVISPVGLTKLVKTPRNKKESTPISPSGVADLFLTPAPKVNFS